MVASLLVGQELVGLLFVYYALTDAKHVCVMVSCQPDDEVIKSATPTS